MSLCCSTLVACSSDDDPERLILPQTVPGPSVSFPVEGEPAGQLELNELLVGATVDDATENSKRQDGRFVCTTSMIPTPA